MRSHPRLKRLYREYNDKYFGGRLPNICVRFDKNPNERPRHWIRMAKNHRAETWIVRGKPTVVIVGNYRGRDWKDARVDLLHEMVHVAHPKAGHGPTFKKELRRLMVAGAFDELL